jgi:hypothetical protein
MKTTTENEEKINTCEELLTALSEDDIAVFRGVFVNNNDLLRSRFFRNTLVKKIWPIVMKNTKKEHFFKKAPLADLHMTFCKITDIVSNKYDLGLPIFWAKQYPAS